MTELRARALLLNVLLPASGGALILAAWMLLQRERRRRLEAEAALIAANARLEDTVAQRTAELQTALGEIEAFALGLDRGIEEERRRLAREVHDQLGQLLTALKMMVHRALQGAPGRERDWPQIEAVLGEGIAAVRPHLGGAAPAACSTTSASEAALGLAGRQFAERTGLACEVDARGRRAAECRPGQPALPHRPGGAHQRRPPRAGRPRKDRGHGGRWPNTA